MFFAFASLLFFAFASPDVDVEAGLAEDFEEFRVAPAHRGWIPWIPTTGATATAFGSWGLAVLAV